MWHPAERYPDPAIEIIDPRFAKYRLLQRRGRAAGDRLALGRGAGLVRRRPLPAVERHPQQPHHALGRGDGAVSVFRKPSNYANGNTRDRQGRLLTCEHGARRVTRTEYDGTHHRDGRALRGQARSTRPTTSWCKSDGSIWFTDPPLRHPGPLRGRTRRAGAADQRLPPRPRDRQAHGRRRRHRAAQRPRASRPTRSMLYVVESRRHAAPADPRLRRDRRTASGSPTGASSSTPSRRHARRLPRRRRRQPVVRLGHGRARASTA